MLRALRTEAIPLRTAAVTVTEESLRNLPEGAAYVARDGRLTLEARRDGDTIRISARSDSLARRVEYYKAGVGCRIERTGGKPAFFKNQYRRYLRAVCHKPQKLLLSL